LNVRKIKQKEEKTMLYEKPELIALDTAAKAIQHQAKGMAASDNNGGTQLATAAAYEADE
jgi:hypothetical protein